MTTRRSLMLGALAAPLLARPALAAFPDKPVTLIMPYAPGTIAGAYARVLAEHMQKETGQPCVVTHRDGGSGTVGMRALAQAPGDGHTIAITPLTPVVVMPYLVRNLGISPDSFAPVCGITENILGIVVKADSPVRGVAELVAAGRRRNLSFGSPGPNSLPQIGTWRITRATGVEFTHIPFRGDAAPVTETIAGRLDFAAIVVSSATPQIEAREVRLIGVFSARRHPDYPDVPTMAEQGIDATQLSYAGMFASRGTPDATLGALERLTTQGMATPAFQAIAQRGRVVVAPLERRAFTALVAGEYAAFGPILRQLGVEPE